MQRALGEVKWAGIMDWANFSLINSNNNRNGNYQPPINCQLAQCVCVCGWVVGVKDLERRRASKDDEKETKRPWLSR